MAVDTTGTPVGEETTVTDPLIGKQTSTESALSNYVGPYVTDMLGRGQALANEGYQAYLGPLTAGTSDLQQQAFDAASGLASLAMPTEKYILHSTVVYRRRGCRTIYEPVFNCCSTTTD